MLAMLASKAPNLHLMKNQLEEVSVKQHEDYLQCTNRVSMCLCVCVCVRVCVCVCVSKALSLRVL